MPIQEMGKIQRDPMSKPAHRFHPLPKQFYSEETGKPFVHCFECGRPTEASEDGYFIQKNYAKGGTIMDLLSEAFRETYDRWMDRVLPPAPEFTNDRPRVRVFM